MPTPLDPRKKPTGVKIHVSSGAGVDITWADGHSSHYDFPYLRDACPCATCNDEREKKAAAESKEASAAHAGATPSAVPLPTTSPVFPMFKPKARAQSATSVGSYAIQINFTDGHNTGIYSYEQLRMICPCAACATAFRNGVA
ncbi:MAG TPA: DUF971 domain-containing protein [Candidatus Acidoferrum sp.]|nr:DUF971 domain-containing protein [Candidatus Acidoferrum sp.]